jgi:hypothetical protein
LQLQQILPRPPTALPTPNCRDTIFSLVNQNHHIQTRNSNNHPNGDPQSQAQEAG